MSSDALNDLRATLDLLRDADDPTPTAPTLDLASLTQLVERAKAAQAHQRAATIKSPCPSPLHVGSSDSSVVT